MNQQKDNSISLKHDYNAVGNGIADDTLALQNFFDYLVENGGTGIIEPGVYLSESHKISANKKSFRVEGDAAGGTTIKCLSGFTLLEFGNCDGVYIKNINLDCQYSKIAPIAGRRKHGLVFDTCNNCTVENCRAEDFLGTGFMAHAQTAPDTPRSNNIVFKNCHTQATQAFNDWLNMADQQAKKQLECNGVLLADCDHSQIIDCSAKDISLFGIEIKNYARWNTIANCDAINCVYGFGMGQQTTDEHGCENNTVNNIRTLACYMGGLLGKAKHNQLTDFSVDFTGQDPAMVRNVFRFQLNSYDNLLQGLTVKALPHGKSAIMYESGSRDNTTKTAFISGNGHDAIVAEYKNTNGYGNTENNHTLVIQSASENLDLKVTGNATSLNETRFI